MSAAQRGRIPGAGWRGPANLTSPEVLSKKRHERAARVASQRSSTDPLRGYVAALAMVTLCTIFAMAGAKLVQTTAFVMVFPVGVLVCAARFGPGPAIFAAITGVLSFDFVFVPPALAFAVPGPKDGLILVCMVAMATVVSYLVEQLRRQAHGRAPADGGRTRAQRSPERPVA